MTGGAGIETTAVRGRNLPSHLKQPPVRLTLICSVNYPSPMFLSSWEIWNQTFLEGKETALTPALVLLGTTSPTPWRLLASSYKTGLLISASGARERQAGLAKRWGWLWSIKQFLAFCSVCSFSPMCIRMYVLLLNRLKVSCWVMEPFKSKL